MFLLLLSFASSVFVPPEDTEIGAVDVFDEESVDEFVQSVDEFALLVVDDDYSDESFHARDCFATAARFLSEKVNFGLVSSKFIPKYLEIVQLDFPFVICFKDGQVLTGFEIPTEDFYVISQINAIYGKPKNIITNVTELNKHITNLDFTIIARASTYDEAYNLMVATLPDLRTCDIIIAYDRVFTQIGAASSMFALFRREDTVIAPFENSTDSLLNASRPYYHVLSDADYQSTTTVTAAVIFPDFVESDEMHDSMLKVALKFPNFQFGIIDDTTLRYMTNVVDHNITKFPDLAVFNYEVGFFYPTAEFSGVEINDQWVENVSQLLTGIENGTVPKRWLSEPEPVEQEDPLFKKLVGTSYFKFVGNEEKDSIVLFMNGNSAKGHSDILQNISHEINGSQNIQFGYINILMNSDDHFPEFVHMPHVEFIKAKSNISYPMLCFHTPDGYRRFLRDYANLSIEAPPIDEETGWKEVHAIEEVMEQFSERNHELASEYVEKLRKTLPPETENEIKANDENYVDDEENDEIGNVTKIEGDGMSETDSEYESSQAESNSYYVDEESEDEKEEL